MALSSIATLPDLSVISSTSTPSTESFTSSLAAFTTPSSTFVTNTTTSDYDYSIPTESIQPFDNDPPNTSSSSGSGGSGLGSGTTTGIGVGAALFIVFIALSFILRVYFISTRRRRFQAAVNAAAATQVAAMQHQQQQHGQPYIVPQMESQNQGEHNKTSAAVQVEHQPLPPPYNANV